MWPHSANFLSFESECLQHFISLQAKFKSIDDMSESFSFCQVIAGPYSSHSQNEKHWNICRFHDNVEHTPHRCNVPCAPEKKYSFVCAIMLFCTSIIEEEWNNSGLQRKITNIHYGSKYTCAKSRKVVVQAGECPGENIFSECVST